ncbi:MAG TPA: helix-turn-helix domain-containing protein [Trebonia sp.]|nr:helix-turn-helix domain-containing protein [Trebonia sp.]
MERARIVLLAADGLTGPQIAERAGCTEPTVVKWRRQYAHSGLAGLEDAPRPGGPTTVLTVKDLTAAIGAFTGSRNDHPRPFARTKDADEILASIKRAKTKTNALTGH